MLLTGCQLGRWRNDVALWRSAVLVSGSPRATLNLAIALRQAGRSEGAILALQETWLLAAGRPDGQRYRDAVAKQVFYLELTGVDVCGSDSLRPLCWPAR